MHITQIITQIHSSKTYSMTDVIVALMAVQSNVWIMYSIVIYHFESPWTKRIIGEIHSQNRNSCTNGNSEQLQGVDNVL